ncbi:MAG: segregation/condensation protein A [Christensenella hongkongensis]|uniref:segregation and condensation protein A n=1 Tax=Christensenella hongkongensis TaxID=270498 RepID=UPI0026718361|nr:segregation/condensation protein A [Christensenella hongkongensis]MDY3003432.1 segregation/condensation protein A [Christensenella hongkongensis]
MCSHIPLFKLARFEGPLDLLLHLVSKAKIDLQDIFVSEITEQYLSYMEEIKELDMDRASEFLNMAATLLYIKSRSLLPARREETEDENFVDPETELIERLRAYKLYKEASERLARMESGASGVYYKLPEEIIDADQEIVIEGTDTDALYLAFLSVLKNRKKEPVQYRNVEIRQDMFSIRVQKKKILERLQREKKISFFSLFEEKATHMEIAVTFIALLELWHISKLMINQKAAFGDIILEQQNGGMAD